MPRKSATQKCGARGECLNHARDMSNDLSCIRLILCACTCIHTQPTRDGALLMNPTNPDYCEAMRLAGFTVAHAVWCVSDGEVLVPLALFETDGGRSLKRYVADQLEDGVRAARQEMAANPEQAQRAVLIYDGFVRTDNERCDALIAEVYEFAGGTEPAYVYQRYRPGRVGEGFAVYPPKLDLPAGPEVDREPVGKAFLKGLSEHEQGGPIWDSCYVED